MFSGFKSLGKHRKNYDIRQQRRLTGQTDEQSRFHEEEKAHTLQSKEVSNKLVQVTESKHSSNATILQKNSGIW
jgi:hypothetical protein